MVVSEGHTHKWPNWEHHNSSGLHSNLAFCILTCCIPHRDTLKMSQTLPCFCLVCIADSRKSSNASEGATPGQVWASRWTADLSRAVCTVCSWLLPFTPSLSPARFKLNSGLLCECVHTVIWLISVPEKKKSLFWPEHKTLKPLVLTHCIKPRAGWCGLTIFSADIAI